MEETERGFPDHSGRRRAVGEQDFESFPDFPAVLSEPCFVFPVKFVADNLDARIDVLIDGEEAVCLLDVFVGAVNHRTDAVEIIEAVKERRLKKVRDTSRGDTLEVVTFGQIDNATGSEINLGEEWHVFVDDTRDETDVANQRASVNSGTACRVNFSFEESNQRFVTGENSFRGKRGHDIAWLLPRQ